MWHEEPPVVISKVLHGKQTKEEMKDTKQCDCVAFISAFSV